MDRAPQHAEVAHTSAPNAASIASPALPGIREPAALGRHAPRVGGHAIGSGASGSVSEREATAATPGAGSSSSLPLFGPGSMPAALQGPKGGYLYVRVVEAGNLDALERASICRVPWAAGCMGLCAPQTPGQLCVALSCASLERPVSTSLPASMDPKTHRAIFTEELLVRSLNFCGSDTMQIRLQTKSSVVGEAIVPLRMALPPPLSSGGLPVPGNDVSAVEEAAFHAIPADAWLPRQRVVLRPPDTKGSSCLSKDAEPYLELQMLTIVDGSLPQLRGAHPLTLAIGQQQEQLVRAYLSFDVVESLSAQEQASCLNIAIERRFHEILVLLLDHIKPLHQHLLMAIRLHAVDVVEALLQAGGAPLLHPFPRHSRGRRLGGRLPRGLVDEPAQRATPTAAQPTKPTRPLQPQLTPLAVACSLGDIPMVEAICQWARQEKVHVDPTAPVTLGHDVPSIPLAGRGTADGTPGGNGGVTMWWDQDEPRRDQEEGSLYGDPPMVMAVRARASLATKLRLVALLAQYGFSADVRSPVDSWTPLLAAVDLGCIEMLAALVKLGARLSADRHVGFTPLHLACQMGQWHLVSFLAEAMRGQYNRVAAWGPSPQYVSLNLVDAYGRTPLDIVLLRYFANPLPCTGESCSKTSSLGSERQKAVDILREFVHHSPPDDPGVVCGWELLRVLKFLDALPSKKAVGAQLWGAEWDGLTPAPPGSLPQKTVAHNKGAVMEVPPPQPAPYGDIEELLQAVRVLVRAGAQTRLLPEDLLQPPSCGFGCSLDVHGHPNSTDLRDAITALGHNFRHSPRYSIVDPDDLSDQTAEEGTLPVRAV